MLAHNWQSNEKLQAVELLIANNRPIIEILGSFSIIGLLLALAMSEDTIKESKETKVVAAKTQSLAASKPYYLVGVNWFPEQVDRFELTVNKSYPSPEPATTSIIEMSLKNKTKNFFVEEIKIDVDTFACGKIREKKKCELVDNIKDLSLPVQRGFPGGDARVKAYAKINEINKNIKIEHKVKLKNVFLVEAAVFSEHGVDGTCICCGGPYIRKKQPTMVASSKELNTPQPRGC